MIFVAYVYIKYSKMNKHNRHGAKYDAKLYPFKDISEFSQNKFQNFSIVILKNLPFLKLSRSWKMTYSISITFKNFPKPVRTLPCLQGRRWG